MDTLDKNGIKILPGDTLKIYHFTGPRNKKFYMYKYVIGFESFGNSKHQFLKISHLNVNNEFYYMETGKTLSNVEIIQGFDFDGISFEQRKIN